MKKLNIGVLAALGLAFGATEFESRFLNAAPRRYGKATLQHNDEERIRAAEEKRVRKNQRRMK